jgi:hypothetical protein
MMHNDASFARAHDPRVGGKRGCSIARLQHHQSKQISICVAAMVAVRGGGLMRPTGRLKLACASDVSALVEQTSSASAARKIRADAVTHHRQVCGPLQS